MIEPVGLLTGLGIGVATGLLVGRRRTGAISATDSIHPDDRAAIAQAEARAFCSGVPQVVSYRRRDREGGDWRWHEYRANPAYPANVTVPPLVHAPGDAWTFATSLGETGDAVRAAKIIEDIYGSAFAFDTEGQFTYATPTAQASLAMTLDDFNAPLSDEPFLEGGDLGWKNGVHPEDYEAAAAELRRCMRAGEPFNYEYRVLRASGDCVWHRFAIRPARAGDGRVTGWYGTGFDIDVFRKTDDALRESERSLREMVETAPALIWCMTPAGEPIYFSRRLREFFGFDVDAKDKPGAPRLHSILDAVIHPDDRDRVNERFAYSLRTGDAYALTHRQRRFDGVYRWVETRIAAMRSEDGTILQWNGVCLDIEEQIRAQDELRQAQDKLAKASEAASLAELSASIAHEVNQPLAAIMTNAQACRRWLEADPPNLERARAIIERVDRNAQSAADIVSHIRALFNRTTGPRTRAALGPLIDEVRELLAEQLVRDRIRLEIRLASDLPPVPIDPVQIQQVLVNIVRNAIEAMTGMPPDRRRLCLKAVLAGDEVRIDISDTGPGLPEPDRTFEAFFSTKAQGMGMGLAICRSIIEAHGGSLHAENRAPSGACFTFTLPLTEGALRQRPGANGSSA
ncbi:PAS domain S-box-containing protein [uncultured Sphingopyxis sp.]|uniref:histidine kinase n=1 Tax=uncultured Sphingopyxis sp. TaxID=310581 RepID=A0A1Y5PPD3_9SPHN|nr:PAS domain-containing sensor histidine kinase [uncultured Sphingopyxis sp.]SBV31893.1 PAS domain S-box-containing protein [uncultured Sphingopyxis sp.]